ncbi:MAG: hypothetical protein WC854_11175, partial [Bacteroidales bacterium]
MEARINYFFATYARGIKVTLIIIDIFAQHSCLQILKKNTLNRKIYSLRYFLPLLFIVLIISSCNPTKYVPEGETLLNDNHIII